MRKLIGRLYDELPASARGFITPVLKPSYFTIQRILSIISQRHLPVYQFKGKCKWDDGTLTILLIGEGRGMLLYLLNRLYAETPTKEKIGKVFVGKVTSQVMSDFPEADMILIGIDEIFSRFLSRHGFFIIPEWVMFKLDLAKPLPKGRQNKTLKSNLKKVTKYKYTYEIIRDPARFEYFYHHMYLPYANYKYGELSLVGGFPYLRKIFERGVLLLVNRGNECIAGFLIEMHEKIVSARYSGVSDGKIKYVEEGALAACYYFTISWAKEKGYEWIDFGHCRPFFNDGAFLHKKKWGMEIMKSNRLMLDTKAVFGMKVCNHQQGLLEFLVKNPFISIDKGKLKGLMFAQQEHPLTLDEIQALFRSCYIPGTDSFVIASLHGFTEEAVRFAASQSPQKLYLTRLNPMPL
jgi:hypothetical protein